MKILKKSRPVTASTYMQFQDLNGRPHKFLLDFNDPSFLYDMFDETLGQDFTNQFKAELEYWLDTTVGDMQRSYEGLQYDVANNADTVKCSLEEVMDQFNETDEILRDMNDYYLSSDSVAFDPDEVYDKLKSVMNSMEQLKLFIQGAQREVDRMYNRFDIERSADSN